MTGQQDQIEQLLTELLRAHPPRRDEWDRAYEAGYNQAKTDMKAAIQRLLAGRAEGEAPPATSPASPPITQPLPRRNRGALSAPTKDQLVREYLAAHPGARYGEMAKAPPAGLGHYTAVRVYSLINKLTRGQPDPHVSKGPDGGFHLTDRGRAVLKSQSGDPNGDDAR